MRFIGLLISLAVLLTGCAGPGKPVKLATNFAGLKVYLFKGGLGGVFSGGLDEISRSLSDQRIQNSVHSHTDWDKVGVEILNQSPKTLVLIGHSFGGDDAIQLARKLEPSGLRVNLLILLDPVNPQPIPGNVNQVWNVYQSNGAWYNTPWFRGRPVRSAQTSVNALEKLVRIENLNLWQDENNYTDAGVSHWNITDEEELQQEIVWRVLKLSR